MIIKGKQFKRVIICSSFLLAIMNIQASNMNDDEQFHDIKHKIQQHNKDIENLRLRIDVINSDPNIIKFREASSQESFVLKLYRGCLSFFDK